MRSGWSHLGTTRPLSLDFGLTPEGEVETEADLEAEFAFGARSDSSAIASTMGAKAAERREIGFTRTGSSKSRLSSTSDSRFEATCCAMPRRFELAENEHSSLASVVANRISRTLSESTMTPVSGAAMSNG